MKKMWNALSNAFRKITKVKPIRRDFKVGHTKSEGEITSFFVTDAHDNKELDDRPQLMTFPVSVLYPEADQEQRAQEYAAYMNKIVEATHQAYENNNLLDVLKGNNNA